MQNQDAQDDGQQKELATHGEMIEGRCVGHNGQLAVDGQTCHGNPMPMLAMFEA